MNMCTYDIDIFSIFVCLFFNLHPGLSDIQSLLYICLSYCDFSLSYRFLILFCLQNILQYFFQDRCSIAQVFFVLKFFISPILNDNLAGQSILGCRVLFSLSGFWIHVIPFWPEKCSQRNQLLALWSFPCNGLFFLLLYLESSL